MTVSLSNQCVCLYVYLYARLQSEPRIAPKKDQGKPIDSITHVITTVMYATKLLLWRHFDNINPRIRITQIMDCHDIRIGCTKDCCDVAKI